MQPWTVEDVLLTRKFMDYVSAFDGQLEIMRDHLAKVYPVSLVQRIFPYKADDQFYKERSAIMDIEELKR